MVEMEQVNYQVQVVHQEQMVQQVLQVLMDKVEVQVQVVHQERLVQQVIQVDQV